MTGDAIDPHVVILTDDDLERFAATLEQVARELPRSTVFVARPDVPAVSELADRLAGAGIPCIDVPIDRGLPGVLEAIAARFGDARWCYVFGGERLPDGAGASIRSGAAVTATHRWPWLPEPLWCSSRSYAGSRSIVGDAPTAPVVLPDTDIDPTWSMVLGRGLRRAFAGFSEVLEDVSALAHLGELDAAYQRAELSWRGASGDDEVQLALATTLLGDLLDLGPAPLRAAARWFALRPEPFTAFAYARAAAGTVPNPVLLRVLAQIPDGAIEYHDGTVGVPREAVVRLRHHLEHHHTFATTSFEAALRGIDEGGKPAALAAAAAITAAHFVGRSAESVVRRLPADRDVALACLVHVRHDLDTAYAAEVVRALRARYGDDPAIDAFVQRIEILEGGVGADVRPDGRAAVGGSMVGSAADLLAVAS